MRGGRSKQRLRNSEVSEFTRINAAPARRGSRRRRHGIAAQSPRKEKEPDKSGSYNYRLVEMHVAHCAFEIALSGGVANNVCVIVK